MEVLAYAVAALTAQPVVNAVNANLHLAGAQEAGSYFSALYQLLKPYRAGGLGAPPNVALGVHAILAAFTDPEARPYLEAKLGPAGIRAISIVLQAAGGPQPEIPRNGDPQFGDSARVMIQAAPAVYPGGVMVRNNPGGPVDAATVGGPPVVVQTTHPAHTQAAPVVAAIAAMQAPPPAQWGAQSRQPQLHVGVPPGPPAPPVPTRAGLRAMPTAVPEAVQAAMAQAAAEVLPAAPQPHASAPVALVPVAPRPKKPEPKTPWGKRGSSLADYTFQVVTALIHLFQYGKLHLGWSSPVWETSSYGLEWGWVRLTTTSEAEAVLLRLPPEEVSAEARTALAKPRGLHRHKQLPAIQEALNKLSEFPEIARSLQLEHYTTRVYSPADDVARSLAEVSPIAWLIAANAVRLGGALSIRQAAFPNGTSKPTDWSKWLDAQESVHKPLDKPTASLETLRNLAKDNPLLDFAAAVEIIDDEGRQHQITAQAIFSPTGVLKGGME